MTIFNPLNALLDQQSSESAAGEEKQSREVSQSAVYNERAGICPKCQQQMGTAKIANQDSVYFCEKCRVSNPIPDSVQL